MLPPPALDAFPLRMFKCNFLNVVHHISNDYLVCSIESKVRSSYAVWKFFLLNYDNLDLIKL
jgi:hypothetical protein